jgi:uncharacterized protein YggU (UPF0235/DUF167 family)
MMPVTLPVKIIPGASGSKIVGWLGHELKICVSAPPKKGRSNQNVKQLLASPRVLAPKHINIVKGHNSEHKIVEFQGINQAALTNTFGKPDAV